MNNKKILLTVVGIGLVAALMAWFVFSRQTPAKQAPISEAAALKADYPGVADDHRYVVARPRRFWLYLRVAMGWCFWAFLSVHGASS